MSGFDTALDVWAPWAESVDALIDGIALRRATMHKTRDGWWTTEERFPAGTDYRFSLDRGSPLPDPRSASQPSGIDGPSRVVDTGAFEWHDEAFRAVPLPDAVIYEIHVGTFTPEGTLAAAADRLDHLVDLGATHVELMPVAEFGGDRGWGYDGVDLYAPHHAYGGPDGLAHFVDAAHGHGLAVILDVVYNHLGPAGNYLGSFGPYFTDHYATPWGSAVNFDRAGSDEVRRFFIDNALMWLRDYHIDGLRLDAVHAIFDMAALHFLEELSGKVHELASTLGRELVVIAESDLNDPRLITEPKAGGFGLDAQWNDDFHHALFSVLSGDRSGYYEDFGSLDDLAAALTRGYRYEGHYSHFRQRRHGRPYASLDGCRLLGYLQNHDQIGNRALGERSGALMSTGRLMIGASVVLTAPLVPMLFQGEEWAASSPFQFFTDHRDPALAATVREGRAREFAAFGWGPHAVPDPQSPVTFERSRLKWGEVSKAEHATLLEWHKSLIALRVAYPELRDGRLDAVRVDFDEERHWLSFQRGRVTVAFNVGEEQASIARVAGQIRIRSTGDVRLDGRDLVLPADAVAVLVSG